MTQMPAKSTSQNTQSENYHLSSDAEPIPPHSSAEQDGFLAESSKIETENMNPTERPPSIRRWLSQGIRTKATVLAIAIGTAPVLIIGGIATYLASQFITAQTLEAKQRVAVEISLQMQTFIQGRFDDIEVIASAPVVTDPDVQEVADPETVVEFLDGFVERDPTYSIIAAGTPDGAFGFLGEERIPLRNSAASYPSEFDEPNAKPFLDEQIPYYLAVRQTLKPAVSPLRKSTTTGKSSFYIAAPAFDAAGRLAYVFFSRTEAEAISNLINARVSQILQAADPREQTLEFRVMDHGTTYYERSANGAEEEVLSTRITVKDDIVQIDGQPLQPGGDFFTKTNRIFIADEPEAVDREIQSIFPKYEQLKADGQATTVIDISQDDGREYVLSYAPMPAIEGLPVDWGVLVYEPTAVAFAPQRTLIFTLLLGTGGAAVLVGAVAAWLADRATKPLLEATDAIERIGQGELDTYVDIPGEDELARLGTNINRTAQQIKQLLEEKALVTEQARLSIITGVTGSELRNAQDLKNAFNDALQVARENLQADRVVIYQFNPDWSGSVTAESVKPGFPRALDRDINDACIPEEILIAYGQGRVVTISDTYQARLHPKHMELLESLNIRANLTVPILQGDQLFGLLVVHHCIRTHEWQESEIAFLKYLSAQLGLAIDRVYFLGQLQTTAEEQRQLKESLQRRALELLKEVDPISKGDLTIRAKVTADEIGTIADSYNATVDSLRKIVLQVQEAASQVTSTTSQNEASVRSLSVEALRQAEDIAKALDVVRELVDAVKAVATNAEQAEAVVRQASQTVAAGDVAMNRTVEGIQTIRATVAETAKKVKRLGESSQRISTVVDLISAFAAQTNMLALNASIEASRAGEQGRGFSVVANEVRSLARQSAEATEEIKKLVASIQAETNEVVTAMETGTEQVVVGTQLVDETRQSLNNIAAASAQINQLVLAIAQATIVQSQASETVTKTMKDVAAIADKTSNEAQQVSDSFEQLRQVAQTLQEEVNQFKVG